LNGHWIISANLAQLANEVVEGLLALYFSMHAKSASVTRARFCPDDNGLTEEFSEAVLADAVLPPVLSHRDTS
jgi:hypothetical protein